MTRLIPALPILFLCSSSALQGQKTNLFRTETLHFADTAHQLRKRPEFGFVLGAMRYNGDITPDDYYSIKELNPAGGIFLRKHFAPQFALRANLLAGQIQANDRDYTTPEWREYRHFSTKTTVSEISLRAEWDIFGKRRYRHRDTLTYTLDRYTQHALVNVPRLGFAPYVFAGGSLTVSNAKTRFDSDSPGAEELQPLVEQDIKNGSGWRAKPGVLFGGGLNFDLGRRTVLGFEAGAHAPFTDYLDGISQTGNPKSPDWFWFGGLTLSFRFGKDDHDGDGILDKNDKCPEIPGTGSTDGCPDADHDGIADREDECPHRKGVRALSGCPVKDADEDGMPDVDDLCPTVPGLPQFFGCPDTDNDGIEDKLDSCATVAGLAAFQGCPDTDGDGIEDKKDACPTEKGPAEYYYGCPVRDTDGDGVEDKLDACLLTPGKAEFKGCPDTDNDGVEDKLDVCPTTPGKADNRGCPVVEKKDQEKLDLAVKAVKFETGKAILKPESSKILSDIADILLRYPDYNLRVEGHTDSQGKDAANQTLSEKRAQACADFLTAKGIAKPRLSAQGFGETKPVADNKTAAGRTKNRRVEFDLVLPEKK
jgi:outer membrane protein OmpA-like peptidoglycan-associated protein